MTSERLYTTAEAAQALGISHSRVQGVAKAMGLGRIVGRVRILSAVDIEAMRRRNTKPGNKGKKIQKG